MQKARSLVDEIPVKCTLLTNRMHRLRRSGRPMSIRIEIGSRAESRALSAKALSRSAFKIPNGKERETGSPAGRLRNSAWQLISPVYRSTCNAISAPTRLLAGKVALSRAVQ